MKVYVKTYGCTLNQADSDIIKTLLKDSNITVSDDEADSDAVIVNTCTVKTATEQRIINKLERLQKSGKRTIVTGCMASANPDLISKYVPSVSIITAPNISSLPAALGKVAEGERVVYDRYGAVDRMFYFKPGSGIISRIPIGDGCLSNCAFCETKRARGPLNSFSSDLIAKAISYSVRKGAKEIELTSQDVGAYGADRKSSIAELLDKIKTLDIGDDYYIRIGMLNPEHALKHIEAFTDALNSGHFYKFIHLPVQSGSDSVLKDMNRDYDISQFYEVVDRLRSNVKDLMLETDIIVGYPTEKEKDFEETLEMVKDVKPDVSNLSKFARRPHARASKLEQLSENEIKRRSVEATRIIRRVQNSINKKLIGTSQDVMLTERTGISINGRNPSYKQVIIAGESDGLELGDRCKVKIYSSTSNALYGKVLN